MREALRGYAQLVGEIAGAELDSLALYGPILGHYFQADRMTASSVLVLKRVDLGKLRKIGAEGARLGRQHISAPLIMTTEFIEGALDTFPLELMEIAQRRATIVGRDCFASLEFAQEHMRLQCEREFRRIQIRLQQGLLAAADREEMLSPIELDVGRHILRTLRGLLWLKGQKEHVPRKDVLQRCSELTGRPLGGVRQAMDANANHGWSEFAALYEDVEALETMTNGL
jgi:hypothetical protein